MTHARFRPIIGYTVIIASLVIVYFVASKSGSEELKLISSIIDSDGKYYSPKMKIDGIGVLRLGSSKDSVLTQLKRQGVIFEENNFKHETRIDSFYFASPSTTGYYIETYPLPGFDLDRVFFEFLNDSLYIVTSGPSNFLSGVGELTTAISVKYAKPISDTVYDLFTCRYTYTGSENDHMSYQITNTFRNDSEVKCITTFASYYDEQCKHQEYKSFLLYSKNAVNRVKANIRHFEKLQEEKDKKETIERYKDFK